MIPHKMKLLLTILLTISLLSCNNTTKEESPTITLESPYSFDVSQYAFKEPRAIPGMTSMNKEGEKMAVNSQYLTKGGKPWLPSYGEFEYSRYPAEHWEDAILKMKSQGFYGISCYVFWIHHEEIEGEFNFTGRYNLRRFLELCKKHDMGVFMRVGPWVNGESRNGGHPDWLVKKLGNPKHPFAHNGGGGKLRTTDKDYLAAVDKLYEQLGKQMKGLYWKEGGPIFAVQLDNEYTRAHSGVGGTALIVEEKKLALKYGMDVALYTTTGWNGAEYIQDHTIPTTGSYADYFWNKADYIFRVPSFSFSNQRCVDDIDTEVNPLSPKTLYDFAEYNNNPYLSCETGIGMNLAYHRRPRVTAADNGAVSLVELGSGCNGMGYFMNLGGNNPVGKLSYMHRSQTQGPLDCAIISNDFQGAIGEFGQVRKSFYEYPAQLNFMADFGEYLAPCRTFVPAVTDEMLGNDLNNSLELQRAIRTDGKKGFLFVNNHIKNDTAYQFNNVQFDIQLKNEKLSFPETPVNIPIGSYFYWPFNLKLSGVKIKYATAQPTMYLEESKTYVFFQNDGIDAEFKLENKGILDIEVQGAEVRKDDEYSYINISNAGLACRIDIKRIDNSDVRFLVLKESQAKQMYKHNNTLYISDAEVLLFKHKNIEVISPNTENTIWMYPNSTIESKSTTREGLFAKCQVNFEKVEVPVAYEITQDGKNSSIQYDLNKRFIGNPNDSIYDQGTKVALYFPQGINKELYDVRAKVDYEASALKLYRNGEFIYDNFYNGRIWNFSCKHLLSDYSKEDELILKILPLQPQDPIYIDGVYWPSLNKTENTLNINSITSEEVYSRELRFMNR